MKSMIKKENLSIRKGCNETGVTGSFYVTAGQKCKTIGWQDGSFQDFGHHLRDEMGGVWVHPVKVADGFWLVVNGKFPLADEYETLPYGNIFRYHLANGVELERFQFSPDNKKGIVVSYRFKNTSNQEQNLKLSFAVRFDIVPVWFSKESGIEDCPDQASFDKQQRCIIAKDGGHDWYGLVGCDFDISEKDINITKEQLGALPSIGQGISAGISSQITLEANACTEQTYYLVGSSKSRDNLLSEYSSIKGKEKDLLFKKAEHYRNIKTKSELHTSDVDFDLCFEWIKYNTDWLIADCDEHGRGLMAGIPEYTWWFGCDNAYSTQGLIAMGDFETAKDTLVLLERYSRETNKNGRIVHEITTNGQIPNPGNSQETGHFITAVYNYWRWTGDLQTVKGIYDYCVMGIDWLLGEMDQDHDLLPSGYGIIEIKGLNVELIDTAVYTCQALYHMYEMSKALGRTDESYLERGEKLRKIINTRLWNEDEKLFVDAVGTPAQILERIAILLDTEKDSQSISGEYMAYLNNLQERLKALPQEDEQPFIINKNWVINTPMETRLADEDKALLALQTMCTSDFVGENGVYLAGFMHAHTMTISTGVQAVAEGRYGRCDQSLNLLNRMFSTFSRTLPGSINEMSPDYGCFTQAWTCYAAMVPVVECFAGFQPKMQENKLILNPCVPTDWSHMELSSVRVGNGLVDFGFRKENLSDIYTISSTGDFDIEFISRKSGKILVNGVESSGEIHFNRGTTCIEIRQ